MLLKISDFSLESILFLDSLFLSFYSLDFLFFVVDLIEQVVVVDQVREFMRVYVYVGMVQK